MRGFKSLVVADRKRCRVVQRIELFFDGFVDRFPVVTGRDAPQAGNAIDHLPAIVGGEMHAVSGHHHTGVSLELFIGREWQPLMVHVDGVCSHVSLFACVGMCQLYNFQCKSIRSQGQIRSEGQGRLPDTCDNRYL